MPKVVAPVDERLVKAPVPAVVAPIEAKFAAPVPEIFHCASFNAKSVPEVRPMVIVPVEVPVPILVLAEPEVLIFVVPVVVSPPLEVRSPAEVIVPVLVVEILPVVEISPEDEIPVLPVMAPAAVILIDEEDSRLVKLVVSAKLMPLITLLLLFEAAGKLIPFKVLELLVLVELESAILTPLIVVEEALVLALVKLKDCELALLVEVE